MQKGEQSSDILVLHHEMFILDAFLQMPLDQSRADRITSDLVNDLLDELKMQQLGRLEIYNATDPRAPGWSFIQPITTSHISGHYFVEPNGTHPNIHMDFYSCSAFSWQDIIPIIHKHLLLSQWHANFLYRKDVAADRKIWEMNGIGAETFEVQVLNQ